MAGNPSASRPAEANELGAVMPPLAADDTGRIRVILPAQAIRERQIGVHVPGIASVEGVVLLSRVVPVLRSEEHFALVGREAQQEGRVTVEHVPGGAADG